MIGRKLARRLARDGGLNGQHIDKVTLLDVVPPTQVLVFAAQAEIVAADLSTPGKAARAVEARPDTIFHLAGVVSGEAELDFDKGYRVNLDGTRALLEAIRATGDGYRPKLVFTSSIAVFGAPFPAAISDDFHLTPLTSYGTQKAMCELMLADHTRRGPASPTRRPQDSSPASSASRSPAPRRCCRWPRRLRIGTPARARRSAS